MYEFQLGNIPYQGPADLSTHYDQINLFYTYKKLTASVRYEQFIHPEAEKEYYQLSQYSVSYRDKALSLDLGNFNETLGNGILLRSFEIPASVFEDQAYRVRQGFYRDLKGFRAGYRHKYFSLKFVRGRSLLNILPPGFSEKQRRPDLSEAAEINTRILKRKIGFILLRNTNGEQADHFFSVYSSGNIIRNIGYNLEFAKNWKQEGIPWFSDKSSYAVYVSLNYSIGNLGLSFELKDYRHMFIGAGISDPPTLVREHTYKLLNRSTHVPELSDESGYQAEVFYSFPGGDFLTINHSVAINDIWQRFVFSEYFVEYQHSISTGGLFKIFADYSRDPMRLENNRYTGGFILESVHSGGFGSQLQMEYQYFNRTDFLNANISNFVGIIGIHNSKHTGFSVIYELSSDPFQTDLSKTFEIERGIRHWIGLESSVWVNSANKLSVFAGQRRGGPACTSGICYEVLDFEGIELRLTTKF